MNVRQLMLAGNRARFVVLAVAALMMAFLPVLAAAAQVTTRSIELSSTSKAATGVSYTVNFTAPGAAGAFVVDFCSNSPVIGASCTPPGGFDASAADSATVGFTDVTGSTSQVVVAGTINASDNVSVVLTGIENPSAAGTIYARIVTYDTKANALLYASDDLGDGNVDEGGVAISITDTVGVSGAVLESLTFCVSKAAISADCTGTDAPVLKLGETVGSVVALVPSAVSTGVINTQISTNAASGAVVRLKSNAANCGGMLRAGAPSACNITPALQTGIAAGEAKFGVKTATATNTGSSPAGTLQPVTGSGYNNSTYALNYVSGDATGVTSIFGDPFLDTNNLPANNKNMALTFGASASNSTPAGTYSADISLIATGKF